MSYHKGNIEVKKTFSSKARFDTEIMAYELFKGFTWFPEVKVIGDLYIIYTFYGNNLYEKKHLNKNLYGEIINAVYDIWEKGYAHRDIHCRNMFYDERFILSDFEFLTKYEVKPEFLLSYDVIGVGLPSPYNSENNCLLKNYEFSVANVFGIGLKEIVDVIDRRKV